MTARGGLWELVVVIMTLEASARLDLALTLPAGLSDQRGDFLFGLFLVVLVAPRGWRFAYVLGGWPRALIVRRWEPPFHHLE